MRPFPRALAPKALKLPARAKVVVTGVSAAGAREAFAAGTLLTTNAALIAAGVLSPGAVAAGSKTETTTYH